MELRAALEAVIRQPSDIKARANLAVQLSDRGLPEAEAVWKATARAAGARSQFFVALALARKFLSDDALDEVLASLAMRYGLDRPKNGPVVALPEPGPLDIAIPDDDEEQVWLGVRIGVDTSAIELPRFARMPTIPIFGDLSPSEFVVLAREVEPVALEPGRRLAEQNSDERAVFVLVTGSAREVSRKPTGDEVDFGVRQGPTVLGEMALLTTVPRRTSLTATGPGLAWRIDAERLSELGREQPLLVSRLRSLVKERLLANLLAASPVLRALGDQAAVVRAFAVRTYPGGTTIIKQGDPPPGLYFMLYGRAEVVVRGPEGDKKVAELVEGDAFGEMSLLSGEPTTATVRVPDDAIALHLSVEDFTQLRGALPPLAAGLAELADVRRGVLAAMTVEPEDDDPPVEDADGAWVLDPIE